MYFILKCLRLLWHGVYVLATLGMGRTFGLRCREVVQKIDLDVGPRTKLDEFRFRLHLSFCQACANYFHTSRALKVAFLKQISKNQPISRSLDDLNAQLFEKFKARP